jgi:hypothetical protein
VQKGGVVSKIKVHYVVAWATCEHTLNAKENDHLMVTTIRNIVG